MADTDRGRSPLAGVTVPNYAGQPAASARLDLTISLRVSAAAAWLLLACLEVV